MNYTNNHGISIPLAVFLAHDDYDGYNHGGTTGKRISVTSLLKSTRQIVLTARLKPGDYEIDISTLLASRMGQAIHTGVESAWGNYKANLAKLVYPQKLIDAVVINPTKDQLFDDCVPIYMEQRTDKQYRDWTITGKYDLVVNGEVTDIKSTGTFTYMKQVNSTKFTMQGSMYRWLNPEIITEDTLAIEYIFKDWSKNMSLSNPAYPQLPVLEQRYKLMSYNETEQWIATKLDEIDYFWDRPEPDLPQCTDEELWRGVSEYKYYKNPQGTMGRSTKNFPSYAEAQQRFLKDGAIGIIVEKKPQPTGCLYCNAFAQCTQKDAYIADGSLKL